MRAFLAALERRPRARGWVSGLTKLASSNPKGLLLLGINQETSIVSPPSPANMLISPFGKRSYY